MGASRVFSGSNYLSLGANSGALVNALTNISICGWFYRASSGTHCNAISVNNGLSHALWFGHYANDNRLYLDLRFGSPSYAYTGALTNTGWYHAAGVFTGGVGYAIYLNGVSQSLTVQGPIAASTSNLLSAQEMLIGRLNYGATAYNSANTAIGWVSLHNVALSNNEITNMMYKPNSGRGLIGCWSLTGENTTIGSQSETTWASNLHPAVAGASLSSSALSPPCWTGRSH